MIRSEILNKIQEVLNDSSYLHMKSLYTGITEQIRLIDDLSMDSIQILELLVDIEEKFNIKFDFEFINAEDILSIKNIIDLICSSLGGSNASA